MHRDQQKTEYGHTSGSLTDAVLSRIEKESLTPHTKTWFMCREAFFWAFLVVVVLVGAAAVAQTFFGMLFSGYEYYELTHGTLSAYILDALPYIWIAVLVLALLIGHFNVRHTKKGYRYPLSVVVLLSILASLVLGVALYRIGLAHLIDTRFAGLMPFHRSVVSMEERMWSSPEEGRLLGMIEEVDVIGDIATITNPIGETVVVDTSELRAEDKRSVAEGNVVRLVGLFDSQEDIFRVCHTLPAVGNNKEKRLADVRSNRLAYETRLNETQNEPPRYLAREESGAARKVPVADERIIAADTRMMAAEMVPESEGESVMELSSDRDDTAENADTHVLENAASRGHTPTSGNADPSSEIEESKVRTTWCGSVRPTREGLKSVIEERRGVRIEANGMRTQ